MLAEIGTDAAHARHDVLKIEGDLAYLHVHAEGDQPQAGDTAGPDIGFAAEAPTADRYLLYLDFQVDGQVFPVGEGSVVRVSPAGRRSLRNTGDSPMTMICIQYKAASFDAGDAADGEILPDQVVW